MTPAKHYGYAIQWFTMFLQSVLCTYGLGAKMKNKILAAIILLTPIAIVVASSIIFSAGISPTNTNNNGVFFKRLF